MGEKKDLPPGRRLVKFFTPFLLHLVASGLSHVDNMWVLGGEIIRSENSPPNNLFET